MSLAEKDALALLESLAAQVPATQGIVELGVYQGGSLAVLARGAQSGLGAQVTGIDPWGLPGPGERYNMLRGRYGPSNMVQARRAAPTASLVRGFSTEVAKDWSTPVGLLFIDAVHTYDAVHADFTAWEPHLAPGAHVIFDDHWPGRFDGVVKAVGEITGGVYQIVGERTAYWRDTRRA